MPFTSDQFFEVFRRYNSAVWPLQYVLLGVGLAAAVAASRPQRTARQVALWCLAALWLWMSLGYHLAFFAAINPAAYVFAAMTAAEAVVLGFASRKIGTRVRATRGGVLAGGVLIAYALVVYPVITGTTGHKYPAAPTFGTPCPTTIFTFGAFCLITDLPLAVLLVPVLWSLIGTVAALRLGVPGDYALLPAAGVAITLWLRNRRPGAKPPFPSPAHASDQSAGESR